MKKSYLLLTAVFTGALLLTACVKQTAAPQSTPRNNETAETAPDVLAQNVRQKTEKTLFHRQKLENLDRRGIDISVFCVRKQDEKTAYYEMQFSTEKDKLYIAGTGQIFYAANGAFSESIVLQCAVPNVYGNRLVITFPDKIQIYSAHNLSHIQTIDLSKNCRQYVDTLPYKDGWLCAFVSEKGEGFEILSSDGQHIGEYILSRPVFTEEKTGWNTSLAIKQKPHMMFADPRQENVIFLDANKLKNLKDNRDAEAVICNLPTGEVSDFSVKAYQNSYGENEKELYFIEKQDAQNNIAAIVFSNGMPQKLTTVARTDFPAGFFENKIYIQSWQADFSWFTMKSLSEKSLVTYYTDSGKTDIVPRAVVEKYSLESKGTDSADSRYSLYNGEYHGGGDASYWKVWLMENATGRMKYIDEIGGMYGGGESAGFLQNNDVYVYSYDNFKIFDTNMNNTAPVWQMTDYLPVGENPAPGVQYRYLMAARRDPISKSVLALYFDMPHYDGENYKDIYLDIEKDSWQLKSTYHVTLINPDGTIGYSRDTGVHALSDWGIRPVSMYMEGADVLHIYSWADSHSKILFEGRLNLTTGKYTSIKDFVRPQS